MFEVLDRQTHSDRQPEEDHRRRDHRRCARILRLLPDRLRAGLRHRAVEAHLRPVGHRAAVLGHRRHHRRLCLGLDRRPHRPAQGVHRHGAELLDRHRPALLHAGQWLDLSHDHALLRRRRRRRPLLRRPAAGPGVHADLQARLGRRTGHLPSSRSASAWAPCWPPSCRATSGACCSPSACCRRWSSCWCGCGCRNRRTGWRARAASRRRASRSPGRCRSSPSRCRLPAAATQRQRRSRPTGSICSSIRAACWCRGSAMPGRRPAPTAWRCGRRRCSCCC